jgi:sugar phosphate isomerase/epimerase
MMTDRLVSLAAGTVLDVDPVEAVSVAATAGWPAVGLWFDPRTWTEATTREVSRRLDDTGVVALDIEPIILGREAEGPGGTDGGERLIDAAAAIGVPHVLVASGGAPPEVVAERLGVLCAHAGSVAPSLRIVLEFLPIFSISNLAQAVEVVRQVGHPQAGVLVDSLHLARSGGSPDDLIGVDSALLPYLQLADAIGADRPVGMTALRDEALHGRLLPGEGTLPLHQLLSVVPGVPVSVELRSRSLMDARRDPVDRARAVLEATRRVIDEASTSE